MTSDSCIKLPIEKRLPIHEFTINSVHIVLRIYLLGPDDSTKYDFSDVNSANGFIDGYLLYRNIPLGALDWSKQTQNKPLLYKKLMQHAILCNNVKAIYSAQIVQKMLPACG